MAADVHLTVALITGRTRHGVRVESAGDGVITGTQKIAMLAAVAGFLSEGNHELRDAMLAAAIKASNVIPAPASSLAANESARAIVIRQIADRTRREREHYIRVNEARRIKEDKRRDAQRQIDRQREDREYAEREQERERCAKIDREFHERQAREESERLAAERDQRAKRDRECRERQAAELAAANERYWIARRERERRAAETHLCAGCEEDRRARLCGDAWFCRECESVLDEADLLNDAGIRDHKQTLWRCTRLAVPLNLGGGSDT
jgi:hypothetical protein